MTGRRASSTVVVGVQTLRYRQSSDVSRILAVGKVGKDDF
jgi:hypothetical protein